MTMNVQMRERLRALEHIEAAIDVCDALGESVVACHLQLGVDLLKAKIDGAALGQTRNRSLQ